MGTYTLYHDGLKVESGLKLSEMDDEIEYLVQRLDIDESTQYHFDSQIQQKDLRRVVQSYKSVEGAISTFIIEEEVV